VTLGSTSEDAAPILAVAPSRINEDPAREALISAAPATATNDAEIIKRMTGHSKKGAAKRSIE